MSPDRRCLTVLLAFWLAGASAAAADPVVESPAAEQIRLAAQHGMRVDVEQSEALDPLVFTELTPFVADEPPLALPPDQDLD